MIVPGKTCENDHPIRTAQTPYFKTSSSKTGTGKFAAF
jgi:hypothetical protein